MNQQFIQSLSIDWNKIEDDSYLREIEAKNKLKEVVFEKPITFFVGENGNWFIENKFFNPFKSLNSL